MSPHNLFSISSRSRLTPVAPGLFAFILVLLFTSAASRLFAQGTNYEGPVGVTGIYNGNVATGCSYDPLTHSARRAIDDIVVPGSIGKYPLKMTRYYNSRAQYYAFTAIGLGPGWAHEYSWLLWADGHKVVSPHGSVYDDYCGAPVGVSEGWEGFHDSSSGTWRLADGGKVVFLGGHVTDIYDPYGLRTRIAYDGTGQRVKVTEPGGRCLWFTYGNQDPDGTKLLSRVQAYDLDGSPGSPTPPAGHIIETVNYTYTSMPSGGSGPNKMMLTGVTYSNGSAAYTYTTDNVTPASSKFYPLVQRCDDVRYNGPMRTIFYNYQSGGPHGAITDETYPGVGAVSVIAPGVPARGLPSYDMPTDFTETRGDGPTRTFTYTRLRYLMNEGEQCPDYIDEPHQQMLDHYTDFQGHTTWLGYDGNWYISWVTDARGSGPGDLNYRTTYLRGPAPPQGIGQITKITHPDNTHVDYVYEPEPSPTPSVQAIQGHYVQSITDESGNQIVHTRDGNHRIIRTDHKDSAGNIVAYEEFFYANNNFGLLSTHHLPSTPIWSGPYVHFQYDPRGLLIAKTNPTMIADWANAISTAPKTTYTYYTSTDGGLYYGWIDRVKTMTLPANVSGLHAFETYEYDKSASSLPVAGRGLVTKITHADGKWQSFGYDAYGNKLWEENELRNIPLIHTTPTIGSSPSRTQLVRQLVTQPITPTRRPTAVGARLINIPPATLTQSQRLPVS